MNNELGHWQTELDKIERAWTASDALPAEQREVVRAALQAQRESLCARIAELSGSGALAQNHSVAASTKGVAVGGGVEGGIHVTEVHYHGQEAPAAPRPKIYHNLPHPDYGQFVGREQELATIHHLLLPYPRSRYHIITIDGIGGIGKSSLALEAACRYVRECDTLPQDERFDAIIWTSAKQTILTVDGIIARRAELRTLDDIYTTIAATLERDDITQARAEDRPAVVIRALARQRTLLVIDNLETVDDEQVMAFIREAPDPTKVIVTTRQRIDVAHPVRLVEMPWQDARQLIAQECDKKHVTLTEEQARKLYERTGGVPLALVWSIARAALGEDVNIVLQRLAHPSGDVARFCFEGVVQRLRDNEAYSLLLASALFAQDAPHDALGQVAGIEDKLSCAEGLVTLERLSLLNRHEGRFSLLPLTHSYLDHELKQAPQFAQAALERMAAYYKQLVAPPPHAQVGDPYWDGVFNYAAIQSLRGEWNNLARIMQWALDKQQLAAALDLFLPIVHFLSIWGLWNELLQWGDEMCQVSSQLRNPAEAWLWIDTIGWVYSKRRQVPECIQALETGRLIAQQRNLTDALILADVFEAKLHTTIGSTRLAQKRVESALRQVDWSSILEHKNKIHRIVAIRLAGTIAGLRQAEGNFILAREWLERELELRRSLGANTAPLLSRLGHLCLKLDDIDSAERFLIEAQNGGGQKDAPYINYGLALVAEHGGESQQALYLCNLAMGQFASLGLEKETEDCRQLLARLQQQT